MSQLRLSRFRFESEAQWSSCLFAGADRQSAEGRLGLRPFAPYRAPPPLFPSRGAYAPAISDIGDLLWRDSDGLLQRLPYGDATSNGVPFPFNGGNAVRMIAAPGALWAASAVGLLQALDIYSLSRLLTMDFAGERVFDIATDGHDGLHVLIGSAHARRIARVDNVGNIDADFLLETQPDASALAYLASAGQIVVLAEQDTRLHWVDATTGVVISSMPVSALRSCFDAKVIGSDGCRRLFIAGVDGAAAGGRSQVLILGDGGDLLGVVPFDHAPTGLVAERGRLYITTTAGLLRFDPADTVPLSGGAPRADLVTPALESPALTSQRWTRIEVEVELPDGCSIEISFASSADRMFRDQIAERMADRSVPPRQRLDGWRDDMPVIRTFTFHGREREPGDISTFAVPLYDVREPYLWVKVAVIAAPGGEVPRLHRLVVHYPGSILIDNLPAIYRRGEFETGNFLRGLVGVLETTTQDLDARIADLGYNIHPQTAPPEWLDFIARWMGLPWDDSLSLDQKRRIVGNGEALAGAHGTRHGLTILLEALLPEQPRRFRIVDLIVDYGLARLTGGGRTGACLPALLAGLPKTATELGNKAILGAARLPCGEPEGETMRFLGRIRIDLALDSVEQRTWSPWLGNLIASMLPATARAELRWLGRAALANRIELSDGLQLDDEPLVHLGIDAVTGAARLAGRQRTTLPDQISGNSSLQ